MRETVQLIGMSATGALTRRVARVHLDHRYSGESGFVEHEHLPLQKRPAMQNDTLRMPNLYPFANAVEFLNRNTAPAAFSRGNDLLRNTVIDIAGKASFFARKLTQAAARRLRLSLLQPGPQPPVAMAHALNGRAGIVLSVRVCRNLRKAQIHAQKVIDCLRIRLLDIARGSKVQLAAMQDQIRFALLRFQKFQLPLSRTNGILSRPEVLQIETLILSACHVRMRSS